MPEKRDERQGVGEEVEDRLDHLPVRLVAGAQPGSRLLAAKPIVSWWGLASLLRSLDDRYLKNVT